MLIIVARKGKPAFLVKIFRFQPPSLCSRRFFYIKYPFTLDLAQRPPPLKQNKTKHQKTPKPLRPSPPRLASEQQRFLGPRPPPPPCLQATFNPLPALTVLFLPVSRLPSPQNVIVHLCVCPPPLETEPFESRYRFCVISASPVSSSTELES